MADRHYFGSGGGGGMSTGASGPRDRDSSRRNEPPKEIFKLNEPVKEVEEGYRPRCFPNAQPEVRLLPSPNFTAPNELTRSVHKHVRMAQWSCDGDRIATGGEYKELLIWSSQGTKLPFDPIMIPPKQNPHSGHVGALAWSPVDPNILVSGDKGAASGSTVAVWNVSTFNPSTPSTLAPLMTFKIPGDALHITFHPSGRHFAVVCPMRSRDEVYFYHFVPSPEAGAEGAGEWTRRDDIALGGISADHGSEEINSLRFTNSGELVCAVSNDGSLNAWVYPVDVEVPAAAAVAAAVNGAAANGDGASGASTPKITQEDATREGTPEVGAGTRDGEAEQGGDVEMADGEADVVAGGTGETEGTAGGEQAETKPVAQAETSTPAAVDGDVDMTSTHPSSVPGTSASSRQPTPPAPATSSAPTSTAPAPAATVPAPTPAPAKPRAKQLSRYRHSVCHSASLLSLAFDPRGRFLVVGGQDALLSLFDTRDWICERSFDVCSAAIRQSAISSDGEYIAVGGDDLFIVIVSAHTGSTVAKIDVRGMVYALSWHPKKNWLVYCTGPSKTDTKPAWYLVRQVGA